ncbi:DUF4230 domain-containing protein [Clostridium sp. AF19-22AC]|nr:DUF4230 domain-containing protein [Clostridium sp. AF19-22AC]
MRSLIIIIAAAALVAVGFLGAKLLNKEPKVTVSAVSIEERLSKCSSLTTARLDYRGIIKYSEGEIDFINKKSFSMIYDAHIKAGIDLSQAVVEVSGKSISIRIPAPEIQDITIDSDTLEFYDEKFALFNWTNKEDTTKAIAYAKNDAEAKAGQTDILEQAREQAAAVIETLIQPITEDNTNSYELTVTYAE